jgi:hypothetical protein
LQFFARQQIHGTYQRQKHINKCHGRKQHYFNPWLSSPVAET